MTSRHDKKILKTHVVDYLNDKVSPRSVSRSAVINLFKLF